MDSSHPLNSARRLLAVTWGFLCAMILAAPILSSHSCCATASVLYLSFSFICHQIPERSFIISGHSLAVCHRCFGIYLGLFLGSLIKNRIIHRSQQARRLCVLIAIIPMLLDALLPFIGLWSSTGISRFFTGLLFGSLISYLLVCGVAEFLNEAPWRRFIVDDSHLKEGIS
jgi:uncharacterized membrane protein